MSAELLSNRLTREIFQPPKLWTGGGQTRRCLSRNGLPIMSNAHVRCSCGDALLKLHTLYPHHGDLFISAEDKSNRAIQRILGRYIVDPQRQPEIFFDHNSHLTI